MKTQILALSIIGQYQSEERRMEYWKKLNPDGTTRTVESHSFSHIVPDAIRITKEEYDEFIASIPSPIAKPKRDLAAEIDVLRAKVEKLEKKK